jgi:hypothetical protein
VLLLRSLTLALLRAHDAANDACGDVKIANTPLPSSPSSLERVVRRRGLSAELSLLPPLPSPPTVVTQAGLPLPGGFLRAVSGSADGIGATTSDGMRRGVVEALVTPVAKPPPSPLPGTPHSRCCGECVACDCSLTGTAMLVAESHTLLGEIHRLACAIDLKSAPVNGDSWLTSTLIDFVAYHMARHYPDVHFLPTNFAVVDLPSAVREPATLSVRLVRCG